MKLKFNIDNKIIERIDTNILTNNDIITCNFSFSKEWKNKEKYVIFWSSKNKSKIMSLGKKQESECSIPENISKESLLAIQIYANDSLKTQKLNIALTVSINAPIVSLVYCVAQPYLLTTKQY